MKQFLEKLLKQSGEIIQEGARKGFQISVKGSAELLSEIDLLVEKYIENEILESYPGHEILSEEYHPETPLSENLWIVDPIDGTVNFCHGYPFYCVSIAYANKGKIVMGGIYNPVSQELFFAEKGKGSFLNGIPIHVSETSELKNSLLTTGFPYCRFDQKGTSVSNWNMINASQLVMQCRDLRRDGSAALDLCYTACGRVDGFWELYLRPWDVAAGSLILTEAGGKITQPQSESFDFMGGNIIATNGKIHQELNEWIIQDEKI